MFRFLDPEFLHNGVFDEGEDPVAIGFVAEQPWNAQERAVVDVQGRQHAVEQQVFQPRAPRIVPEVVKGRDHVAGHQKALLSWHGFQNVQAHGVVMIGRVKIDHVTRAIRGDVIQPGADQIAMRIDQGEPVIGS
jgi:hypothetical protein